MRNPLLRCTASLALLFAALAANPAIAAAQEGHEEAAAHGAEAAAAGEHEEHAEHAVHEKNEIAMFVGASNRLKFEDNEVGFTIGFDYARSIYDRTQLALGFEFAGGNIERDWITFLVVAHQPFEGWARPLLLYLGPGLEVARVDEQLLEEDLESGEEVEHFATAEELADEHSTEDSTETKVDMLVRMGLGWPFHAGQFSIIPNVNFDLVGEDWTLVAGVTLGYRF
jgi:hypothetical protein